MNSQSAHSTQLRDLPSLKDFHLGALVASPSRRLLVGPGGRRSLQPQVMAVFVCLARQMNRVVTRRALFENCWGNAPVGDDSLNRALSAIRHALAAVGATELSVETVPRTGYRLSLNEPADCASQQRRQPDADVAFDCWRAGLPRPDVDEIEVLETRLNAIGGNAEEWGVLALLLRKAVEYCDPSHCASFVTRCEQAARRALTIDPQEGNALVALAGVIPLFGNWPDVRVRLAEVRASNPAHVPAGHDLAVLEMATGRPSAAVPLIESLLAQDGLAASFHYKRMYHLWTIGDLNGAERAATRALQLWPHHPAIWTARFWTLIFTGRAELAFRFVTEPESRPSMPPAAVEFLAATARVVRKRQSEGKTAESHGGHVQRCLEASSLGPAHAVSSLLSLCALDSLDAAFEVARAYYLGQGRTAVPLRRTSGDPSITDQHRRVTQPLFIPAAQAMRNDPRFLTLCEDMGLADYWSRFGITPDFRH